MVKDKIKIICSHCKGNGYLTMYLETIQQKVTAQCPKCDSEGEIYNEDFEIYSNGCNIFPEEKNYFFADGTTITSNKLQKQKAYLQSQLRKAGKEIKELKGKLK